MKFLLEDIVKMLKILTKEEIDVLSKLPTVRLKLDKKSIEIVKNYQSQFKKCPQKDRLYFQIEVNSFGFRDVKEIIEKINVTHIKNMYGKYKMSIQCFRNLFEMTPTLAKILANFAGDGCITPAKVSYINKEMVLINSFIDSIKKVFCGVNIHFQTRVFKEPTWRENYSINLSMICGYVLNAIYGNFYGDKVRVPKKVKEGNKEIKSAYLRAIYEDEGGISFHAQQISLTSTSKFLVKDTKEMLEDFNIKTTIFNYQPKKQNNKRIYILSISDMMSIFKFAVYIGFNKKYYKTKKLKELIIKLKEILNRIFIINLLNKNLLNVSDINKKINRKCGTTKRFLLSLEKEGLVKGNRTNRYHDGIIYSLTDKGKEFYDKLSFYFME